MDAMSVLTCGGEFNSRHIVKRSGPKALDDPKSSTRPQVRRDHLTGIPLVTGSEPGRAQLENRTVLTDGPGPSSLERGAREGESPVVPGPCRTTRRCLRVGLFGMQPQSGGKFRPRLNMGERPIANKYREVKMKRTLKRESKSA
ncbi:hypothetical protein YC2023_072129 [Brassica napus]